MNIFRKHRLLREIDTYELTKEQIQDLIDGKQLTIYHGDKIICLEQAGYNKKIKKYKIEADEVIAEIQIC